MRTIPSPPARRLGALALTLLGLTLSADGSPRATQPAPSARLHDRSRLNRSRRCGSSSAGCSDSINRSPSSCPRTTGQWP